MNHKKRHRKLLLVFADNNRKKKELKRKIRLLIESSTYGKFGDY